LPVPLLWGCTQSSSSAVSSVSLHCFRRVRRQAVARDSDLNAAVSKLNRYSSQSVQILILLKFPIPCNKPRMSQVPREMENTESERSLPGELMRAFGAVAFLTIVSLILFGAYFETHDDSLMGLIAAGRLGASGPSPDLWYSHRLLGLLLSGCYDLAPSINWYVGLHITVQIAAHTAWLWLFQRIIPGPRGWWCFTIWFVLAGWLWLIPLQFTTSAFAAFSAGMALIVFDANRIPAAKFMGLFNPCFLTGVGFLYVSHLIRHQSFLLGCLTAVPVIGLLALSWPRNTTFIQAIRGVLVAGLLFASHAGEAYYYDSQPECKDYRQSFLPIAQLVNSDRLAFVRPNPRFAERQEQQVFLQKLGQVGWTPHDLEILRGGFVDDKTVFSMEKKAAGLRILYPPTAVDHARFWSFVFGAPLYWSRQLIVLSSIVIAGLVVWRLGLSRSFVLALVGSLIWFFVLSAYLKAYEKLPYRVLRIIALGPVFTVFMGIVGTRRNDPAQTHPIRFIDWMIVAFSIIVGVCLLQNPISLGRTVRENYSRLQDDLKNAPLSENQRYVLYDNGIMEIPPFADAECFKGWSWVFLDCLADHPLYRERIRSWGWRDASEGLRTDPDARLMSNEIYAKELQQFFNEHYPQSRLTKEWSGQEISIYRVVERSDGPKKQVP
ncbi:MAG: hypothetical protein JWM11_4548, partial [Planctomycetaceae bacterium]|nr:hypothetical protein [Planctomycetaceae bacterium]